MNTTDTFIGYLPVRSPVALSMIRGLFDGSGAGLRIRGRNPNRAQYYSKGEKRTYWTNRTTGQKVLRKHSFADILPLEFASYYALYVRNYKGSWSGDLPRKLVALRNKARKFTLKNIPTN